MYNDLSIGKYSRLQHLKQSLAKPENTCTVSNKSVQQVASMHNSIKREEYERRNQLHHGFFPQHLPKQMKIPINGGFISDITADEKKHRHTESFKEAVNDGLFRIIPQTMGKHMPEDDQ